MQVFPGILVFWVTAKEHFFKECNSKNAFYTLKFRVVCFQSLHNNYQTSLQFLKFLYSQVIAVTDSGCGERCLTRSFLKISFLLHWWKEFSKSITTELSLNFPVPVIWDMMYFTQLYAEFVSLTYSSRSSGERPCVCDMVTVIIILTSATEACIVRRLCSDPHCITEWMFFLLEMVNGFCHVNSCDIL